MSKITPRIDIAFKKIFGVEENKDLLISLINAIVAEEDRVSDIKLLNPYNPKNFLQDKLSILDIKAKGIERKKFNIEIQVMDEADYDKRALYYWANLYTEQLRSGDDYSCLSKAIGIHILNFTSILDSTKYHNVFRIKERESHTEYFKDLELHTIELKKFPGANSEKLSDLISKIKTRLDMWVAFLTRHDLLNTDRLPDELNQKDLQKALNVLEIMNFSTQEREVYEETLKWFMVEANTLKKFEAKGVERGIEIGKTQATELMIKNMLKQQFDWELICNISGLSKDELQNIAEQKQIESIE